MTKNYQIRSTSFQNPEVKALIQEVTKEFSVEDLQPVYKNKSRSMTKPEKDDEEGSNKLNPKDQMASTKLPVHLVPTELVREAAKAMYYGAHQAKRKDGGLGYGEWNWRESGVSYTVMVAAIIRHALELLDGKEVAEDSKVSHLGHIAAGVGILLDAKKHGVLKDDRAKSGEGK